jgi:hypothetical protein
MPSVYPTPGGVNPAAARLLEPCHHRDRRGAPLARSSPRTYGVAVRLPFAHVAVLTMLAGADDAAPGAAVTVALCGHWQHEPPCPLAPHHTAVRRDGSDLHLRTLFSVEPALEGEVRTRIDAALAAGRPDGSDPAAAGWRLRESGPGEVRADEAAHAARLARG